MRVKTLIFALFFLLSQISEIKSQIDVIDADSFGLVAFYNNAQSFLEPWDIQWDLTTTIDNWHGITLEMRSGANGTGYYVIKIDLHDNNLSNFVADSIQLLSELDTLDLSDNFLGHIPGELLPLSTGPFGPFSPVIDVRENYLKFDEIQQNELNDFSVHTNTKFFFDPQKSEGEGGVIIVDPDGSKDLKVFAPPAFTGESNTYTFFKSPDGVMPYAQLQSGPSDTYSISDATSADDGFYRIEVTNSGMHLDALTLDFGPKELKVITLTDSAGVEIIPNQLLVSFPIVPNINDLNSSRAPIPLLSSAEKDTIRAIYGATKIDSCICGTGFTGASDLELWEIPDSLSLELERIRRTSRQRARVESSDYNYKLKDGNSTGLPSPPDNTVDEPAQTETDVVYIGLIDSGVQWDHPDIKGLVYSNSNDPTDGIDDDGNCLVDDFNGYDFLNDTSYAMDFNGHGTHLAGIMLDQGNPQIQVINAKASDSLGFMTIFDAVCGMYYAMEKGARVLNLSWGYSGESCQILEKVIVEAGDPFYADTAGYLGHDVLIITSAGNDGIDNDTLPHYPSSYQYDHIISVAALNGTGSGLNPLSNFGVTSVDIAAPGTGISSAFPVNGSASLSGTSQAAAAVSRLAAELFQANPNACARGVKECILGNADAITGGGTLLVSGGKINGTNALACATSAEAEVCHPVYSIKMMLEGPYNSATSLMNDDLRVAGLIPTIQPFANLSVENDDFGFPVPLYNGSETITNTSILSATGNDAIVDWVLVGVIDFATRDSTFNTVTYGLSASSDGFPGSRKACLLQRDGDVVDVDGNLVEFDDRNFGGYVFVMPRNHAAVRTSEIVGDYKTPIQLNFIDGSVATQGGNTDTKVLMAGVRGLISGDLNQDGTVDNSDRIQLLNQNGQMPDFQNGGDLNLDGEVNAADLILYWKINEGSVIDCDYCDGKK